MFWSNLYFLSFYVCSLTLFYFSFAFGIGEMDKPHRKLFEQYFLFCLINKFKIDIEYIRVVEYYSHLDKRQIIKLKNQETLSTNRQTV